MHVAGIYSTCQENLMGLLPRRYKKTWEVAGTFIEWQNNVIGLSKYGIGRELWLMTGR